MAIIYETRKSNIVESFGTSKEILNHSGTILEHSGAFLRILQSLSGLSRTLWDIAKTKLLESGGAF